MSALPLWACCGLQAHPCKERRGRPQFDAGTEPVESDVHPNKLRAKAGMFRSRFIDGDHSKVVKHPFHLPTVCLRLFITEQPPSQAWGFYQRVPPVPAEKRYLMEAMEADRSISSADCSFGNEDEQKEKPHLEAVTSCDGPKINKLARCRGSQQNRQGQCQVCLQHSMG